MAVIPVKVRLRANNRTVITHAFLHGSSVTFYTESLIRKLEVERTKVKISLSTLEKKNSPVESYLIRDLVESDLDDIILLVFPRFIRDSGFRLVRKTFQPRRMWISGPI